MCSFWFDSNRRWRASLEPVGVAASGAILVGCLGTLSHGQGVIGYARASDFLRDAQAGVDSVDFLLIGDSNTCHEGYGWLDGLVHGCVHAGIPYYGSPIYPMVSVANGLGYGVVHSGGTLMTSDPDGTGDIAPYTTLPACPAADSCLERGDLTGPAALTERCDIDAGAAGEPAGVLSPVGCQLDYGWVPQQSGKYYNYGAGLNLPNPTNPSAYETGGLAMTDALTYRIIHGAGGGGSFTMRFRSTAGPSFLSQRITAPSDGDWRWTPAELALPADPSRTAPSMQCAWGGAGVGPNDGVVGPIALGWHSVYRTSQRGVSATPLAYRGGAALADIAHDLAEATDGTLAQYLQMIRERQIAAGGTGRVVVYIQGGVNLDPVTLPDLPAAWVADITMMVNRIAQAWSVQGYPSADLATVAMVSHPIEPNDELLGTMRDAARTLACEGVVDGLSVIDFPSLVTWQDFVEGNWHRNTPIDAGSDDFYHLKQAGYGELGRRIVSGLLNHHHCWGDVDGNGVVDGEDLSAVLGGWGFPNHPADLTCDGEVTGADLAFVLGNWGPCDD